MDAEIQKKLREKFDTNRIGLKPKISCKACSNSPAKVCGEHKKARCDGSLTRDAGCGQWITERHFHVEFVSHADVTDRLLDTDADWDWEPLAIGSDGLPVFDKNGGLWIRLTIGGKTRIGYGGADGKTGEDAVKETISDAIKTTAMRFGVALDLWRKGEESGKPSDAEAAPRQERSAPQQRRPQQPPPDPPMANGKPQQWSPSNADEARKWLLATCAENGWDPKIVANRFKAASGVDLKTTDGTAAIVEFRASLFSVSDGELRKQPAASGTAR